MTTSLPLIDATRKPLRVQLQPIVDLRFPDFERHYEISNPKAKIYAFEQMPPHEWHREFVARVFDALDRRRFLPVYRMCDGEFIFALNGSPEDGFPWWRLGPRDLARRLLRPMRVDHRSGSPEYGFESYTPDQRQRLDEKFAESVRFVAARGVLAMCLQTTPLAARFIAPICDWLDANAIPVHRKNYYPFYSVYVLMHGPDRFRLLGGRRVLVVTGLTPEKRHRIERGLYSANATTVQFLPISRTQAMLETIDLSPVAPVDVVLVGAGVGSANVLRQLAPLDVPCLDVGFALSTLAEPQLRWNRPYCIPDAEFDPAKVRWGR